MIVKVFGAPIRSAAHPEMTRPGGASQMAALARTPNCATVNPKSEPILGLKAAVENHIRKHQKNATVAIMSCSILFVMTDHPSKTELGSGGSEKTPWVPALR